MKRLLFALALTSACLGDEGPPNPVPGETPDIPPAATPGEVKRSVTWRSPMGGPAGNLLIDGDFEHSVVIQGSQPQSGWLAFTVSPTYMRGETGGICRSGLRCGVLAPGVLLYGRGTAARDSAMVASVYAKPPPERDCYAILPSVISCNLGVYLAAMSPESQTPDEDGWCFYRRHVNRQTGAVCMAIESNLTFQQTAIVDQATIVPSTGTTPLAQTDMPPPSHERRERLAAAAAWIRSRMKIGEPFHDRPAIGLK